MKKFIFAVFFLAAVLTASEYKFNQNVIDTLKNGIQSDNRGLYLSSLRIAEKYNVKEVLPAIAEAYLVKPDSLSDSAMVVMTKMLKK